MPIRENGGGAGSRIDWLDGWVTHQFHALTFPAWSMAEWASIGNCINAWSACSRPLLALLLTRSMSREKVGEWMCGSLRPTPNSSSEPADQPLLELAGPRPRPSRTSVCRSSCRNLHTTNKRIVNFLPLRARQPQSTRLSRGYKHLNSSSTTTTAALSSHGLDLHIIALNDNHTRL